MQNARITLHPSKQRMQVRVDGILQVDSINMLDAPNSAVCAVTNFRM